MKIKSTEMGLAIVLPYQDNANYSKSVHGFGITRAYAHKVLAAWSTYLDKLLLDRLNQMQKTLLNNVNNLCFVSKNLVVTNQGERFSVGAFGSLTDAVNELREERWKEFLYHHAQQAIQALVLVKGGNPPVYNDVCLDELLSVLNAADHDCIDND